MLLELDHLALKQRTLRPIHPAGLLRLTPKLVQPRLDLPEAEARLAPRLEPEAQHVLHPRLIDAEHPHRPRRLGVALDLEKPPHRRETLPAPLAFERRLARKHQQLIPRHRVPGQKPSAERHGQLGERGEVHAALRARLARRETSADVDQAQRGDDPRGVADELVAGCRRCFGHAGNSGRGTCCLPCCRCSSPPFVAACRRRWPGPGVSPGLLEGCPAPDGARVERWGVAGLFAIFAACRGTCRGSA